MHILQVKNGVIHWDSKLLQSIHGNEKVDRLAIVVSQESGSQLLGVPKIARGTGEAMADAVYAALRDWNCEKDIVAMSFDTTNSNSGCIIGACTILQQKLKVFLLWLACRHHIYEIFLGAAFESKFPVTSGPGTTFFIRFREKWNQIDQNQYEPGIRDSKIRSVISDQMREEIIHFCNTELANKFTRDDYRELLQLTVIFLGEDKGSVRFRTPGAISHARWMSKAIYSLKIFMFSFQFDLSKKDLNGLRDFCLFVVLFYTKAWTRCSHAVEAPKQDLIFFKRLFEYETVDKELSKAVLHKVKNHLWYLSPETVALSLFDDNVTVEEKNEIRETILSQPPPDDSNIIHHLTLPLNQLDLLRIWKLHDFVDENTINFFKRFGISEDFLQKNASEWNNDPIYLDAKKRLSSLEVVNDNAERGIKLIEDFNRFSTKDEEMLQYTLQTVAEYRKMFPSYNKSDLTN